jgi:hypothetical protein
VIGQSIINQKCKWKLQKIISANNSRESKMLYNNHLTRFFFFEQENKNLWTISCYLHKKKIYILVVFAETTDTGEG